MSNVDFVLVRKEPEITHSEFVQMTAAQFPAVAEDILDKFYEDLIHLQVACLTRYANDCLAKNDLKEFERTLRFVDYVLPKVDDLLDNALHVSFVEMLSLDKDTPINRAARQLLSPWQFKFYLAMGEFYNGTSWRKEVEAVLHKPTGHL